jgi:chromosome segregation protein
MQDVIFNGTTSRKPASRSSVELVFDNADHRAGGQWSQFTEIAVKRVLTRDGTSSYYINNQPVRRRDVQDVFLGTGLGPRAYAIIGQGTISRIIESRPEELRLFLKRRPASASTRSAAARPKTACPTRARTSRVEDILRELNANLDKLESRPRWPSSTKTCRRGAAQAAPAVVLKRAEADEARAGSSRRPTRPSTTWRRAWPTCATSRPSWRPSARRTTPPATASTRRRAGCTRPAPRSAGWRPRSASWSKAASAPSSAWCS